MARRRRGDSGGCGPSDATMSARQLLLCTVVLVATTGRAEVSFTAVGAWADSLATKLWDLSQTCSFTEQDKRNFASKFKPEPKNDELLVKEVAASIHKMTQLKISAVRRLVDTAEGLAHRLYEDEEVDVNYTYYGSKVHDPEQRPLDFVKTLNCSPNSHFPGDDVNLTFGSVHIPTNVYHRATDVLRVIIWTEELEAVFKSNYRYDPSLSWQYFGSSQGVMRQYPGVLWEDSQLDMFDCRMRLWYIDASLSPKDVVILVDNSGSMTGMRHQIARHLVNNILETLGSNDFVNVLKFSKTIEPIIECLDNVSLVQATLGIVREMKRAMKWLKAEQMADFRLALTTAFQLFNMSRDENSGACCNRAIMLITDGIPDIYKDIFDEYNWKPDMRVRMFLYLIGEEEPVAREMQWIACNNNGYYVPLETLSEVREKVLRYMPVMSRPLVLQGEHPVSWTPMYADAADPRLTDLMWQQRENEEQSEVSGFCYPKTLRGLRNMPKNCTEDPRIKRAQDLTWTVRGYHFVTSVSMPVLDIEERRKETAQILGVAGTDVPIEDIKKLMLHHKVGVNGYTFMITNNGHIVIHPELRPEFVGVLKPNYNSVDLSEVEHVDEVTDMTRTSDPAFLEFRRAMIEQEEYDRHTLDMKYHFDDMGRVSTVRRLFSHIGIKDTPFTLAVALPHPYGLFSAVAASITPSGKQVVEDKLKILRAKLTSTSKPLLNQVRDFLLDNSWTVHPDWVYCTYHYDTAHQFDSVEDEVRNFLQMLVNGSFQCSSERHLVPPEQMSKPPYPNVNSNSCYCDMRLLSLLLHDAVETMFWPKRNFNKKQLKEFGASMAFLATHSGLTRWKTFQEDLETSDFKSHTRSIEETWYRRAVELHEKGNAVVVYSVPIVHEDEENTNTSVTASRAVFTVDVDEKVPVAVVGCRFQHEKLFNDFRSITSKCPVPGCTSCSADELACYLVDNNGYIIASEVLADTGRFFGEVEGNVMSVLVSKNIFRKINIIDYQAICLRDNEIPSRAPFMITPMQHLIRMFRWLVGTTLWLFSQTSMWQTDAAKPMKTKPTLLPMKDVKINRTYPEPCIKQVDLYQLQGVWNKTIDKSGCAQHYIVVQKLHHSNVIMVAVNVLCSVEIFDQVQVTHTEVQDTDLFCSKVLDEDLIRRRPKICVGRDKKAEELQEPPVAECGSISQFRAQAFLVLTCWSMGCLMNHRPQ